MANNEAAHQFIFPPPTLSVSDIVRLATAGVKVELGPIVPLCDDQCPIPPAPPDQHIFMDDNQMEKAIWDRWERSKRAKMSAGRYGDIHQSPFKLLATQHGEKVWVSVHPHNFNYEPFQLQDQSAIFPSDALMAQLALWEQNHQ